MQEVSNYERTREGRNNRVLTGKAVDSQHTKLGTQLGKQEKLNHSTGDAIDRVDCADFVRAEAEAAGELEREGGVVLVRDHTGVVEEHRQDLVVRY